MLVYLTLSLFLLGMASHSHAVTGTIALPCEQSGNATTIGTSYWLAPRDNSLSKASPMLRSLSHSIQQRTRDVNRWQNLQQFSRRINTETNLSLVVQDLENYIKGASDYLFALRKAVAGRTTIAEQRAHRFLTAAILSFAVDISPTDIDPSWVRLPDFSKWQRDNWLAAKAAVLAANPNPYSREFAEARQLLFSVPLHATSVFSELWFGFSMSNIRAVSTRPDYFPSGYVSTSRLTDAEKRMEVDAFADNGDHYVIYEIKDHVRPLSTLDWQTQRIGEQLGRQQRLGEKMYKDTSVVLVSFSGFEPQVVDLANAMGVETMGP